MTFPFEVDVQEVLADPEPFIDAVFSSLGSEFMSMPTGPGFVDYASFETGYESLKRATRGFTDINVDTIMGAAAQRSISLVVTRSILGFTPPEWAFATTQYSGTRLSQGFVRNLDRNIRLTPLEPYVPTGVSTKRVRALAETAAHLMLSGGGGSITATMSRLDKVDTSAGETSIRNAADMGIPYAMLLYERFLGRPFAGHRDSVSELVGDALEVAIEGILSDAGISFRKTKRAERIPGFDQAPDFIVPSEFNPQVIIEAKICEDDGTARDKVTRIQHLHELSLHSGPAGKQRFQVIACISGRGFGVRRSDMRKLIEATDGKVFSLGTLGHLVEQSRLSEFRTT